MNKKLKIFLKVIYYVTAFSFGIFLALYIPNVLYYNDTMKAITTSLNNGNYDKAMIYIGGYFNDEYVYLEKFDDGSGIVIFESVTLASNPDPTETSKVILRDSYSGFLFNVSDKYNVYKTSDNKTVLVAADLNGKETNITLLDRDKTSDGFFDTINTYDDAGFVFLDLSKMKIDSLAKLTFYDSEGEIFKEVDLSGKNLNFDSQFFTDVHVFTDVYNVNNNDSNITSLDTEFRAKSTHYIFSNYSSGNINVTTKAIFIILGYFLVVYLIADSVLGKRYVYRGIKFVICKIFKINPKPKKEKNSTYSSDYYSNLTLSFDLSSLTYEQKQEFPDEVEVNYNNETDIIKIILKKENDYKETERVKAGVYTNMMTSLPKDEYSFSGVTSQMKISGFKTNVLIIVKRRGD